MKTVLGRYSNPNRHWVGDGFPVRSLFSYNSLGAHISPFLLLDFAGPHYFEPASMPRGVGSHPHRGFETVTIVYEGEVSHKDSTGKGGTIGPGDVQWMTAAGGILHEEFHSAGFTRSGGPFRMIQLWVNLPAKDKMGEPGYQSIISADIPVVTLPESALAFTTSFTEVRTLAHWLPVSSQVLEDAGQLDSFLTGELGHGLNVAVEAQLVNGTGSNGQLAGLLDGATAYTVTSPQLANEIDILRHAIKQVQVADFTPTAIILNPSDWYDIEIRHVASGDDAYAAGPPKSPAMGLWGVPVVVSNAIAAGQFLLGDFQRAGALFVRQPVTIEMARHDDTGFQKNMVSIRALTRLALVVTNATALVKGSL